MSKGSPVVTLRIPDAELSAIDQAIERSNGFRREAPWTRSDFILIAIREKLAKMQRGRDRRQVSKRKAAAAAAVLIARDVEDMLS